jgi:hypothetical protein
MRIKKILNRPLNPVWEYGWIKTPEIKNALPEEGH